MDKKLLFIGALLGMIAIATGAFGSHVFKDILIVNNRVDTFQTGIDYHMFHVLALLVLAILPISKKRLIGYLIISGILLFSGSLYILALTNFTLLGMIAPFGGTSKAGAGVPRAIGGGTGFDCAPVGSRLPVGVPRRYRFGAPAPILPGPPSETR